MVVLIPGNSGHPGIRHSMGLRAVSSVLFTQKMLQDSFRFKIYVLRHYQLRYVHIYDFIVYSLFLRMFRQLRQATN